MGAYTELTTTGTTTCTAVELTGVLWATSARRRAGLN